MKLLKWIPIFCSMLLFGQENLVIMNTSDSLGLDSLWYQDFHNSFSERDEEILLSFDILKNSSQTNFGVPIVGWYWQNNQAADLRIGDRILDFGISLNSAPLNYQQKFPHTQIIYSQAYSEGQRLNFAHSRKYKYGSVKLDYDRLGSLGYLSHEKNKYTKFILQGSFKHPEIPYQSNIRLHTFKNESQWNGGVSDDSLFLAGTQTNWELLPVNWSNLESTVKHIGLDWTHSYKFSEASKLSYELNLSQDSLFYQGLQDDSLFFPIRLDSASTYQRAFSDVKNTLKWSQKITEDKSAVVGIKQQSFKYNATSINKWTAFGSLESYRLKNSLYFEYGKAECESHTLVVDYTQGFNIKGVYNKLKFGYHRANPNWMQNNASILNQELNFICVIENSNPIIDRFAEWDTYMHENLKFSASYHSIEGFNYFNEQGISSISEEDVNVFQAQFFHHLNTGKWHWNGTAAYQNSSSKNLPLANLLLNQKVYWQGDLFKEATETQIGIRGLYRTAHPGITYAPFLGDFYVNPSSQTNESLRLDVFANFKIKTVKVYLAYEHLNSLWQGEQYVLKPYPMAKPTFRLSLIWNFYD